MGDWDWDLFLEVCILIVACLTFLAGLYTSRKSQQIEEKQIEMNSKQNELDSLLKTVEIEMNRPRIEISHLTYA